MTNRHAFWFVGFKDWNWTVGISGRNRNQLWATGLKHKGGFISIDSPKCSDKCQYPPIRFLCIHSQPTSFSTIRIKRPWCLSIKLIWLRKIPLINLYNKIYEFKKYIFSTNHNPKNRFDGSKMILWKMVNWNLCIYIKSLFSWKIKFVIFLHWPNI